MRKVEQQTAPRLGIAVLQWNHVDHTNNLLDSLDHQLSSSIKMVICDNGSEPQCWIKLREKVTDLGFEEVNEHDDWQISLARNTSNSGFAAGMNVAIKRLMEAGCEWVWILNNDVLIQNGSLKSLLTLLSTKSPGWYGTMLSQGNTDLKPGLIRYNKWLTTYRYASVAEIDNTLEANDFYIDGASMMVHRSVLESVGLLSERTFLYFEELDYARRVRAARYTTGVITEVCVEHIGGGSSDTNCTSRSATAMYHETWSTLAFTRANHPLLYIPVLLFRTPCRILSLILKSRLREIPAVVRATSDFLRGFNRDMRPVSISERYYFSRPGH